MGPDFSVLDVSTLAEELGVLPAAATMLSGTAGGKEEVGCQAILTDQAMPVAGNNHMSLCPY